MGLRTELRLIQSCHQQSTGAPSSETDGVILQDGSGATGITFNKPHIVGEVPIALKEYLNPKKIILTGGREYEATLQYYEKGIAFIEAKPITITPEAEEQFACLVFTNQDFSTEGFEDWYRAIYPDKNKHFLELAMRIIESPDSFVLDKDHFQRLVPKPITLIDRGLQDNAALRVRLKEAELETTKLRQLVEELRVKLIDPRRIERFKTLTTGLLKISHSIDNVIRYHNNYFVSRNKLFEPPEPITGGKLSRLNQISLHAEIEPEDDGERAILQFNSRRVRRPIPKEITEPRETEYLNNKYTLEQEVRALRKLTKQYLGEFISSTPENSSPGINPEIELLIKSDFEVCPRRLVEKLVLKDRQAISSHQSEVLALTPLIRRPIQGFLHRVHSLYTASYNLGYGSEEELRAFGAGDGNEVDVYMYEIRRALDPDSKFGFWINIDSANETIARAQGNHLTLTQLLAKLEK